MSDPEMFPENESAPTEPLSEPVSGAVTGAIFEARLPLVLASASPRRKDLLASVGLEFEILPVDDEPQPDPGEEACAYAMRAALAKAEAAARLRPQAVVLAADTVVVLDEDDVHDGESPGPSETILGKPADESEAMMMLARLAGNTHRVVTGCCLVMPRSRSDQEPMGFYAQTEVEMDPQPLAALMAYAATKEPLDKAGAYAIQGRGAFLVRRVSGSYTNVVGLPLAMVLDRLQALGAVTPYGG